jgi:flagellar basal body-associated protein FliL
MTVMTVMTVMTAMTVMTVMTTNNAHEPFEPFEPFGAQKQQPRTVVYPTASCRFDLARKDGSGRTGVRYDSKQL